MEALAEAVAGLDAMELGVSPVGTGQPYRAVLIGESAKRTMHAAEEIAASLHHARVHWGHMLLALAQGEAEAVRAALRRVSLTTEGIRDRIGNEPV